ncbi:MAG: hypothetical protein QM652_11220 [Legionella sp.]|uniref:hypothetical protein n=1 Tax=Legionella sp. TaxID=459 RepID=UPI0039E2F9F2
MNRTRNRKTNIIASFFLSFCILNMTGCIDLSAAKYHPVKKEKPHSKVVATASKKKVVQAKKYRGEVHTMLGGLGVFSTGMKELSSSVVDTYEIPAPSSMWYNAGDVTRKIVTYYYKQKDHRPIILVGHSLGANEQIKVARNLNKLNIPVALLVTVDAVSQTIVPPNVKHAMNFYKPGYVPMFSGLKLKAVDPVKTNVENINVGALKGVKVNHFTIDKNPVVQAMIMKEVKKVTNNANRAKA